MAEKPQRKGFLGFTDRLITILDGVKGIAILLGGLSLGGGAGTLLASDTAKVDSLAVEVDSVKARLSRFERNQLEMYSAQIEADTTLKAVLESRAANRRKAAESRAETEKLFNDITGGAQ